MKMSKKMYKENICSKYFAYVGQVDGIVLFIGPCSCRFCSKCLSRNGNAAYRKSLTLQM